MASLEVREHFADCPDTIAGIVEPVPIDQDEEMRKMTMTAVLMKRKITITEQPEP